MRDKSFCKNSCTFNYLHWICVAFVGCFLFWTLKPGQPWDGDSELYIQNALNILHGASYSFSNYVLNTSNAIHPAAYPPGLPLLLAPVLGLFGINYIAIKSAILSCFILTLTILAKMADKSLKNLWIALLVLALGTNPYIWNFKDVVYSEFPFMLFSYLTLFAFNKIDDGTTNKLPKTSLLFWTVICGLAMGLAYEVRAIGIVLFASVAVMSLYRFTRLRYFGLAALLLAFGTVKILSHLFPADVGTYVSYFAGSQNIIVALAHNMLKACGTYAGGIAILFGGSHDYWTPLQMGLLLGVLVFTGLGVKDALHRKLSIYEAFTFLYGITLLLYPVTLEPSRYALPLLPLILYYFFIAVQNWTHGEKSDLIKAGIVCLAFAVLYAPQYVCGGGKYSTPGISERVVLVDDVEAKELYAKIQESVPTDALILASKPTIIALFSNRHATNPPQDITRDGFLAFVAQRNITWLVELKPPMFDEMSEILPKIQDRLNPVFSNKLFVLYKIIKQ
jgi:hypothetical protein